MKPAELPWSTTNPRARAEWDFRARFIGYDDRKYGPFEFLPDDEIIYCNYYEIERSITDRNIVLKKREDCGGWLNWRDCEAKNLDAGLKLAETAFDTLLKDHYQNDPDGKAGSPPLINWFYYTWPEWPDQPYLSIPPHERKRRFGAMWGANNPRTLPVFPLVNIYKSFCVWTLGKLPWLFRMARQPLNLNTTIWEIPNGPLPKEDRGRIPKQIVAFEIDLNRSNRILLREFLNFLVQRRREKGYKDRGTLDLRVEKGRWRAELVSLGAGRLIQSGLTYKEAAAFTERVTGESLYAREPGWSRAYAQVHGYFGPTK